MPQVVLSLDMLGTHCYKKNLPNENNPPIWMVYPSHTSLASILSLDPPFMFSHMTLDDKLC
jgi:hypothetical protein